MKTRSSLSTLLLLGAACALPSLTFAAGYKKAEITRLHKDVKVLKDNIAPRDAAIGDEITSVTSVATGAASRAELKFPDNSLTRLGANSRFTLRGDQRTLDLDQGVMLLQVPKQLGGAKVRTAAVTAAVTGTTVLFEYLPGGFVKLIVIEGVVDLYFNSDPSKFTNITAGQMIIMQVDSKQLPAPVDVDLSLLLKTSKLINGDDESMPNFMEVSQALQQQQKELQNGDLVATNFVLPGRGTLVELSNDTRLNLFKSFNVQDGSPSPGGPKPPGNNNNGGNGNPNNDGPGFDGFVPLITGTTFIGSGSFVETNPHVTAYNTETGEETRFEGRIYNANPAAEEAYTFPFFGFGETDLVENPTFQPFLANASAGEPSEQSQLWAVFKFEDLVINGTPEFDFEDYYISESESEEPVTNVIFAALNDVILAPVVPEDSEEYFPEGSQLDLYYSAADKVVFYSQNGHVTVDQDFYINGDYQDFAFVAAGINSDVNLYGSVYTGGHILVSAGRDFYMDSNIYAGSMDAAAGRDINTTSANYSEGGVEVENKMDLRAKRSINITDSSQLRVMSCNSDAVMSLLAQGGNINLDASSLEASNIEMTAMNGNGLNGDINVVNSHLSASNVLKAQTLGPDGRINIGGGSLSAGNIMKLYAEGANGGVYFTGDTTLTAGEIHIAGRTVQVNNTVAVTVPGAGTFNVYADQDKRNFNTEGFGSFSRMPTTKEFNDANRPAFNAPNVPSE